MGPENQRETKPIPLISREEAQRLYDSQPEITFEKFWEQVRKSLKKKSQDERRRRKRR